MLLQLALVKFELFLQLIVHRLVPHGLLMFSLNLDDLNLVHDIEVLVDKSEEVMYLKPRIEYIVAKGCIVVEGVKQQAYALGCPE